jgi:hypothetical protein
MGFIIKLLLTAVAVVISSYIFARRTRRWLWQCHNRSPCAGSTERNSPPNISSIILTNYVSDPWSVFAGN